MVATSPVTASDPSAFSVAPVRCKNVCEAANAPHAEVAVVPGEAFGTDGYFRLSYAMGDADLEEGVSRIGKLLAEAR